jgi:hypothetical protein
LVALSSSTDSAAHWKGEASGPRRTTVIPGGMGTGGTA